MRARTSLPLGVFGAVATPGRPLSPLSAARVSPVAARRGGSSITPPRLYPPTRRGRACAAAARAQHLGGPTSPALPSILFTWWVFDRRRAHPGSTRACARADPIGREPMAIDVLNISARPTTQADSSSVPLSAHR